MSGGFREYQDHRDIGWQKNPSTGDKKKDVIEAHRRGDDVETKKKFMGGENKKVANPNANRLENEHPETFQVAHVGHEFSKVLQKARCDKKLTQAQLAQKIAEKPSVVADYEAGRAIPNQQVINKMNRALGVQLPSPKK